MIVGLVGALAGVELAPTCRQRSLERNSLVLYHSARAGGRSRKICHSVPELDEHFAQLANLKRGLGRVAEH
jgi:hypothetical protein